LRAIARAVEGVSDLRISFTALAEPAPLDLTDLKAYQALFLSRDIKDTRLVRLLEAIRACPTGIPVVLVYSTEPDGKAFLHTNRYGCLLFSELDRFGRSLTAHELSEALKQAASETDLVQKLVEVSMAYGPCSTGD
jgi:hypothetical protein